MVKGAVIGAGMYGLAAAAWAAAFGGLWSAAPVLMGVLFVAVGAALGVGAERIRVKRFRRLVLLGLGLVYVAALAAAAVLLIADGSVPARDVPGGAFFLGTVGYVIYAMFTLPALLVGVFLLERWTADRRQ